MKQIKFRVSKVSTGEFVGWETLFPTDIKNTNYAWALSANGNDWAAGIFLGPNLRRVQFTGILDKNDKEVYEDDVVDVKMAEDYGGEDGNLLCRQVVKWSKNGGYFSDEDTGEYCPCLGSEELEIEVVGDIHQNPELMNK